MIKKLALAAVCAIGLASPAYAASIQVTHAEAFFEADDNRFEVFMTITNSGATADTLYAVKSKVAKSSSLNVSSLEEEEKGLESIQTTTLSVKPGQPLVLSEEGAHIQLEEVKTQVEVGETMMVTLFFENAGPIKVKVMVKAEEGHKS
jgi:copper(I)-binding protein